MSETLSLSRADLYLLPLVLFLLSSLLLPPPPLYALLVLARADGAVWVWAWVRDLVCMSCPPCATVNC
jgi:hypothetical protein